MFVFVCFSVFVLVESTTLSTIDVERNLFNLDRIIKLSPQGKCQDILDEFAQQTSQFIFCANKNAKPIQMCRQCASFFIDLSSNYQALSNHSESGHRCKDILTSQDSVQIIEETYHYIAAVQSKKDTIPFKGLWNKANCYRCYTEPFSHNSSLSKETVGFFERHKNVEECFQQFPYEKDSPRNSSSACQACQVSYQNLSFFYRDHILGQDNWVTDNICFDILDAMNMTQRQWGENFNCGRKLEHHWITLVAIIIVACLPLIFYPVVRILGTSAEERVINQRHITDFFDQNLRRLSFNRSRFSRSSRGDNGNNSGRRTDSTISSNSSQGSD